MNEDSPDGGTPPTFPPELVRTLIEAVRGLVEERGWDAPFTVYGLRRYDRFGDGPWTDNPAAVEIELLGEGAHPFEDLPGLHLPAHFDAAILATEGWQYPERLMGASLLELELEGLPSTLPDRVENRLLSYLSRTGDSAVLLLTYEERSADPTELYWEGVLSGRVQDAFRRFVGLPVAAEESVVHMLGRFWLGGLLVGLASRPDLTIEDPLAIASDPLETFVAPLREAALDLLVRGSGREVPEALRAEITDGDTRESTLRTFALEKITRLDWEDLRKAALLGALDVGIPVATLEWCDAGMFSRLIAESVPTQRELLDELLLCAPSLAVAAFEAIAQRGWAEPDVDTRLPAKPPRPAPAALCPCRSGRRFDQCHGRLS